MLYRRSHLFCFFVRDILIYHTHENITVYIYRREQIVPSECNGQRIRQAAGTDDKKQANELAAKHYYEMFEVQKLGYSREYTWRECVVE